MDLFNGKQKELFQKWQDYETLKDETNIYIFMSFDLVNSTKLKTDLETKNNWPNIVNKFYSLVTTELEKKYPSYFVWKYIGDEVLLCLNLVEIKQNVYSLPKYIYKIQNTITEIIKNTIGCVINIKATLWLAKVKSVNKSDDGQDFKFGDSSFSSSFNIKTKVTVQRSTELIDFFGPDIDTGFRISKFAYHHKVVLSANLAYLLTRMQVPKNKHNISNNLKIVSYEKLKGVWNGAYYPIIWYCPNWNSALKKYRYDEFKNNECLENVKYKTYIDINELENVFEDNSEQENINKLIQECSNIIYKSN